MSQPLDSGRYSHALPVYTINLRELVKSKLNLSEAIHVGWRYFWKQSKDCPSVEVMRSLQNKRDVATSRSSGPGNSQFIRALERVIENIGTSKHWIRVLSAPPLVYSAVWLKSIRHRADKIIVVETIIPKIRPLKVYQIAEFLDLLRPEAAMLFEHSKNLKAFYKAPSPSRKRRLSTSGLTP